MRFQPMAPTSPAKITPIDSTFWSTTSLAMVVATWVPKTRKATKLKNAAHATARRGESTRVDTTVAIELAASWKPLTKSKPSATSDDERRERRVSTGGQACLRTMDSTTSEMSSIVLTAPSIASTMSFHFSTSSALNSPEKRCATDAAVDARRPRSRGGRWRRGAARSPAARGSFAMSATFASAAFAPGCRPARGPRAAA